MEITQIWFDKGDGTVYVDTPKNFLEAIGKWALSPGQEEGVRTLAEIDFDDHEGGKVPARSIEEYRAFLAKGWTPIKPSDFEYRMQILKNYL